MNNIGFNIRKIREKKGFSQEFIAEKLGINQSTYGKLERDMSNVTLDRLFKIADILEEDITSLLDIGKKIFSITRPIKATGMWKRLTTTVKRCSKS
ncbi:MAG: helix-turn-helix domain-containing protein [Candidatus Azobacteroides sp.]|jgi:transcriptional regulator with XRE-family HTH domain|nr:helix-turn-helix domain-containing protein [Candidatus Azobacteroides sp.]